MRELLEGMLSFGLLVDLFVGQSERAPAINVSINAAERQTCLRHVLHSGTDDTLLCNEKSNLRAASSAALRSFLAYIRELASVAAVPLFELDQIRMLETTPRRGSSFAWSAAAHASRGFNALLPRPPPRCSASPVIYLSVADAWTPFTWNEWVCVLELRRSVLLAAELKCALRLQWQQDKWDFGCGGLEPAGMLSCCALTVPMLRRLPRARLSELYWPTWWNLGNLDLECLDKSVLQPLGTQPPLVTTTCQLSRRTASKRCNLQTHVLTIVAGLSGFDCKHEPYGRLIALHNLMGALCWLGTRMTAWLPPHYGEHSLAIVCCRCAVRRARRCREHLPAG